MRGAISRTSQGPVTFSVLLRMMLRLRPASVRSLRSLSPAQCNPCVLIFRRQADIQGLELQMQARAPLARRAAMPEDQEKCTMWMNVSLSMLSMQALHHISDRMIHCAYCYVADAEIGREGSQGASVETTNRTTNSTTGLLFCDRVCSSSCCSSWGSALNVLVSSTLLSISFTAAASKHCLCVDAMSRHGCLLAHAHCMLLDA